MRLTTWNCCTGPLPRKLAALRRLAPDIAVIPECPRLPEGPASWWLGDNPRKGLGIVATGAWSVAPLTPPVPLPRYVQPLAVSGPERFLLIAVWAMNEGRDRYVRGLHRAIDLLAPLISNHPTVAMGDFNANAIWDHEHPEDQNHSALVAKLDRLGLVSAYHAYRAEAHGAERTPTFFSYRHRHRPYHLDYCFIPKSWLSRVTAVRVGRHASWASRSDHMPLSLTLTPAPLVPPPGSGLP